MKIFASLLILTSSAFCQSWPAGATALWYGTDHSGITGSTLNDLTGNGHNATLTGTTQTAAATVCNGSSDVASFTAFLHNSTEYTVFAFVSSSTPTGFFFTEADSGTVNYTLFSPGSGGGGSSSRIQGDSGGTGGGFGTFGSGNGGFPANYGTDWHGYYLQRSGSLLIEGIIDEGIYQTVDIGNVTSLATTLGGLCALNRGSGGPVGFWTGSFGPVVVYPSVQSPAALKADYAAGRAQMQSNGVYMRDTVTPLYPTNGIWQRQGTVLATSGGFANITASHSTTDCRVTNPCFQLWGDNGSLGAQYWEAPDTGSGPGTFAFVSTAVAAANCAALGCTPAVTKMANGKYLMLVTQDTPVHQLDAWVSAAGRPDTFTLLKSAAVTASQFGWSDINNSSMALSGSTVYLATSQGTGPQCGGATTADGITWSLVAANPISGAGGAGAVCSWPDLHLIGSTWYMWSGSLNLYVPGNIYRFQAASFNSIFTGSSPGSTRDTATGQDGFPLPVFIGHAPDELGQFGAPQHVEVNGITYMFYEGADASAVFHVKMAIANMTMAQLVTTGEGMTSDVP